MDINHAELEDATLKQSSRVMVVTDSFTILALQTTLSNKSISSVCVSPASSPRAAVIIFTRTLPKAVVLGYVADVTLITVTKSISNSFVRSLC